MKITSKQLKRMIREEFDNVAGAMGSGAEGGHSGAGVGVPGEFAPDEQKYVMAFSAILGISPEEAAAIPPEDISDMVNQITGAYRQKKMDVPPLNEPKGGWGDPFEDHPDNEQGSRQRRFESKTKK